MYRQTIHGQAIITFISYCFLQLHPHFTHLPHAHIFKFTSPATWLRKPNITKDTPPSLTPSLRLLPSAKREIVSLILLRKLWVINCSQFKFIKSNTFKEKEIPSVSPPPCTIRNRLGTWVFHSFIWWVVLRYPSYSPALWDQFLPPPAPEGVRQTDSCVCGQLPWTGCNLTLSHSLKAHWAL